jgi:phosphotransacetylase/acyl dehydratase
MTTTDSPFAGQSGMLRNRTFDQIAVGDSVSLERTLGYQDIELFAIMSGDVNPAHVDPEYAAASRFHGVIAHGMWGAALISALLGTRLPGPGTIYRAQTLRFLAPVRVGDTLTIRVTVSARDEQKKLVTLACSCTNQDGQAVIEGEAEVLAPLEPIERPRASLPEVRLAAGGGLQKLLDQVKPLGAVRAAVVHPCDAASMAAALEAAACGLVVPVLVAPRARLLAIAAAAGLDLSGIAIEDVAHSHAAAARAVQMAARGEVEVLIRGSLDSTELLTAVLAADAGLRTKRRLSHCFLMHTPAYPRPFILTDAGLNIAPTLEQKADITRNAIDLAHVTGVALPRVAILAARETINARMPATLDAAALCKMADRGQIEGAVLDGPLAFDNAVSVAAARLSGIASPVAGRADVLVAPDLEAANLLARQLAAMGDATSAGVVLGARVPIVLNSAADSRASRIASCAIALMLAHHYRASPP